MRRAIFLLALALGAAASSCSDGGPRVYDNNDLQLISAYTAKDLCSCLFVMRMDEAYCRAWTKASPAVADARIDVDQKRVRTSALLLWGASARYVDESFGCQLE